MNKAVLSVTKKKLKGTERSRNYTMIVEYIVTYQKEKQLMGKMFVQITNVKI